MSLFDSYCNPHLVKQDTAVKRDLVRLGTEFMKGTLVSCPRNDSVLSGSPSRLEKVQRMEEND